MQLHPFSLKGKKILITGASSGIGRATAIVCSQLEGSLIITGRNINRLEETINDLDGDTHELVKADLTNKYEIERLIEITPKLDGVVYCAGTQENCIAKMLNRDILNRVIETNLYSVIELNAQLLLNKKINKGASIVIVSSAAALNISEIGNSAYSASKGALISFGRVLATELSSRKIRVNTVMPAMVKTNLMNKFDVLPEEFIENEKKYPLGYGEPEDVANAIAFLLSNASKWITGTNILLDGGYTLK